MRLRLFEYIENAVENTRLLVGGGWTPAFLFGAVLCILDILQRNDVDQFLPRFSIFVDDRDHLLLWCVQRRL